MAEYKNNHVLPRFLIDRWASPAEHGRKVWVHEVAAARSYAAVDGGSPPYKFASEKYLYVPEIDGERAAALEKWFSDSEGALGTLLKIADKGRALAFSELSNSDLRRAILCLASFKYRSAHDLNFVSKALTNDPKLRERIGAQPDHLPGLVALDHLITAVTDLALYYSAVSIRFTTACQTRLLLCDRPALEVDDILHVPVAPTLLMSISKATDAHHEYQFVSEEQTPGILEAINAATMQRARNWVVAASENELEGLPAYFASDKYRKGVSSEALSVEDPRSPFATWWHIKKQSASSKPAGAE